MRLSGPTLIDELRRIRWRSLRMFMLPALVAAALYAFYTIGGYGERDMTPATPRHGNLYGTIIDENQRPIRGASVTIAFTDSKEPVPASAPGTDAGGHFYLQDMPAGHYVLQATADGFDMQTQSTVVKPGQTLQIKIPLYPHRQPKRRTLR
jgi:hypothetical protein